MSVEITEPNIPTTDNHFWEKLITFQTVAIYICVYDAKFSTNNWRPHYRQQSALDGTHKILDLLARKQSPPKLWECHTKGKSHFDSTRV